MFIYSNNLWNFNCSNWRTESKMITIHNILDFCTKLTWIRNGNLISIDVFVVEYFQMHKKCSFFLSKQPEVIINYELWCWPNRYYTLICSKYVVINMLNQKTLMRSRCWIHCIVWYWHYHQPSVCNRYMFPKK